MRLLYLFLALFAFAGPLAAQHVAAPGASIGINLAPLNTGTPELQADYFFNRYIGLTGGAGYRFRTRPLIGAIPRFNVPTRMHNAYCKIGLKGQLAQQKAGNPVPWAQALYIYSAYDEAYYDEELGFVTQYQYKGSSNAFAFSLGCDFPTWRKLDIRAGFQLTAYNSRYDYIIGKSGGFQLPAFIQGINYRLGKPLSGATVPAGNAAKQGINVRSAG